MRLFIDSSVPFPKLYKTDTTDKELSTFDKYLKDETSFFFGGTYKDQLCYYEIEKRALKK